MNSRGFVPWMAMLTFYCLTVVMLVTFFTVHCGSATGTLFGVSSPTETPAPILTGRPR